MKQILIIVIFCITCKFICNVKTSNAFLFRNKIKNAIILDYTDGDIKANFNLNNYFKKNNNYYLCGVMDYVLYEQQYVKLLKNNIKNKFLKNFFLYVNNKRYRLYSDSVASVILPWKNSNINVNSGINYKVCFIVNINIDKIYKNKISINFENDEQFI